MWKHLVTVGEERLNKMAGQVLANEKLMRSAQDVFKAALDAKSQAAKTVRFGLGLLNLPTLDDIKRVEGKLDEIQSLFSDIQKELDRVSSSDRG